MLIKKKLIILFLFSSKLLAIDVAFVTNNSHTWLLSTAICSILLNADEKDELHFHIFNTGLSKNNLNALNSLKKLRNFDIRYYKINFSEINGYNDEFYHKIVYAKSIIPNTLKNLDKILILDSDIIVMCSLASLWKIDLGDNFAAGAQGQYISYKGALRYSTNKNPSLHINSGVILINAKKYREENMLEKFKQESKRIQHIGDEDIFVNIFDSKIKLINLKWNMTPDSFADFDRIRRLCAYSKKEVYDARKNPAILHFSNKSYLEYDTPYIYEFYHYLNKTPFRKNLDKLNDISRPIRESEFVVKMSILKFVWLKLRTLYYTFLALIGL